MNDILKLLGTEYSLQIGNYRNGEYFVTVTDSRGHHVKKSFEGVEAETAPHDILLYTVEQCIMDLKEAWYQVRLTLESLCGRELPILVIKEEGRVLFDIGIKKDLKGSILKYTKNTCLPSGSYIVTVTVTRNGIHDSSERVIVKLDLETNEVFIIECFKNLQGGHK